MQTILITGGTGSFGRKFIEMVEAKRLIVYSRDELKQHEMKILYPDVSYFIGNIKDKERLTRAFEADVDIVIHAAALKQVPSCEYNPYEAIKTNILGAQNIIDAAIDTGVKKVIALSTDKAVNPTNIYGATKMCMEKLFIQGNSYAGSKNPFSCVRYGNVWGSRGSVIPVFDEQSKTGTIQVTDKRMTRFWITLEEAVNFVVQSLDVMQGGEIFVPKIKSSNIMDIAETYDCDIEFTGIRDGEKLHETLISEDEARHTVDCGDYYKIEPFWRKSKGKINGAYRSK